MNQAYGVAAMDHWRGLRAVLRVYEPGYEMSAHRDSGPRISLVVRGYVLEWTSVGAVLAGPGDVVTKPGSALHANRFGVEPVLMLSIHREPAAAPDGFETAARDYAWLRKGPLSLALRDLALTLAADRRPADGSSAWRGIQSALDGHRPRSVTLDRVSAACALIEAEAGCGLRVEDVARAARVHPVHLTRLFQSAMGCTPSEYLHRVRLAAAVDLLNRSQRCAADIAATAGFADQAHLCRSLRRRLGVTPGALRRRPHPLAGAASERAAG